MSDYNRIERLIREARVQRSAALGMAIGDFLANSWLLASSAARRALASLRRPKARPTRTSKTLAAR